MTGVHSTESLNNKEKSNDILLLIIWSAVLCLCAVTLKSYYLAGQPPLWDNLAYQLKSLHLLTNWLDGDFEKAVNSIYAAMYPAYLLSLTASFLIFGFNSFSPYLVSAFFGAGCMIIVYLLSCELGSGRRAAFWGAITLSLLPSFIYQNFLQTRNDFPAAFFIAFSWIFLLRGIKSKDCRLAFLAGVLAGVGTLFKASTPGYVAWGILALLALPEKYTQTNVKDRIKLALLFIGGAVLTCGWHFLPHLGQILNYYQTWGEAKTLVILQYNLQSNWTDYFFYLKNIVFVHLGEKVSLGITLVGGLLLIRQFIIRRSIELPKEHKIEWSFVLLIFLAAILPIIFISWRQSLSSLGDVPVLPLLAAVGITFLSKISIGITLPRYFLVTLLPVLLILSISNLPIIEKQFSAKGIETFSHETLSIRKELGLGNTPMMQVFSHPFYNIDSLAWSWLVNPKTDRTLIHEPTNNAEIIFPEEADTIASKLNRFPLLIMSEFPGTVIHGENFNTLNRLHGKINSAIKKQGQFIKLRSIDLLEGRFPIHFMLNKNYSVLRPTQVTADNWVEWKGEVQYFASRPAKLIWRGVPIRKMNSFQLVDKDNPASSITLNLKQVLLDGRFEYQSKKMALTRKLRTFIVTPESPNHHLPASKIDKRSLAFHEVETEVIKYD
jgi:4-amino-4-deoxy-L-arabinose transferase-like glycosyltransferase